MKKVIAWLLVLALTAAISIGATLAYLTDTDEDVNVMTLGKVKIDQLEYERVDDETANEKAEVQEFHDNKPLLPAVTDKNFDYTPGDTYVDWTQIGKDGYTSEIWNPENINNELDKMVFIKNKGNYDAFVRSVFAFEAGKYATLEEFQKMIHLNLNTTDYTWEWVQTPVAIPNAEGGTTNYFVATATYNKVLAPGALTEISLSQIALDKTATNEDVEAFGETYQILVKSQGIQADGFNNAIMALNDGFDVIDAKNIPWEIDAPVVGTDVRTALKYLNADPTGTDITAKVTKVVFGLNSDHPEIVNGYEGILTSVEQDVPVHTYYVPNGSNYDVYLLANSEIYLPKDSSRLFQDMSALTSVDTSNLNTSRVELMNHLFFRCSALKEVDLSNFDMQNVTTLKSFFNLCSALTYVDVTNWNTSKVTDTSYMFYKAGMSNLDLRGLDMQSVTTTSAMFGYTSKLKTVDATGWDLTSLKTASGMFVSATAITDIIGSGGWYMPNVVAVDSMIQNCDSLKYIDVTGWDLGSAENMYSMFWSDDVLVTIDGCENWDTGNVTNMKAMFETSHSLKDVDVSTWDTSSVTDMSYMFRCHGLEELDVSNWDVSNVTVFNSMFSAMTSNTGSMSIKALDLSKWNPKSAVKMNNMFHGCSKLTELDMSGWDMPNLTTTSHMFSDCFGLQSVDFTGWNTPALTSMDGMFNDCRTIKEIDVSHFDTENCLEFSQMFEACYALEKIIGMDQWDTSSGYVFDEMFNVASKLKEVDLSSFDTSAVTYGYTLQNGEKNYHGYGSMFNGTTGLQKLIMSDKFVFAGDGTLQPGNYPKFPNPAPKEGYTAMWRNVETGELFLGKDIPEKTAATYEAYYQYAAKGAKMIDALHYLNANTGSTKITTKVTSVTFGLTKDYEQIASTYTGVLADQEQEGPVYAYYVPNGDNYDVYFLSDDVIYSPKDSSSLFKGMKALTTVNTTNYRFSGVEKMQEMFAECSALTTLDTTGWDTSKITDMTKLFYKCEVLQTVPGIGGWDMSNVETMFAMFARAYKLKTLDVSNWNTGSVTSLYAMFQMCFDLEYLDVADWDVSKVTDFSFLFKGTGNKGDMKINNLDISKWDTSSAKTFQCMFYGCAQITELDLSTWKTDNLEDMSHMFADCYKLEKISFAGWNTPKLNTVDALFNNCESLKSVDVSDLDTANVVEFSQAFEYCYRLEKIIGLDKWVTTSGQDFGEMFSSCGSLKELDLSSFDTTNAKDSYVNASNGDGNDRFNAFLSGCNALEKITLGKNFSFDGDGSFTKWTFVMPSSTKVNGWDGKWYDADGNAYAPSAIPEETARTYYAVKPVNP